MMDKETCPTEEYLCSYVEGSLSQRERIWLENHLVICANCLGIVSDMVLDSRLLEGAQLEKVKRTLEESVKVLPGQRKVLSRRRVPNFWEKVKGILGEAPQVVFTYRFATGAIIIFLIAVTSTLLYEKLKTPTVPPSSVVRGERQRKIPELIAPVGEIRVRDEIGFQWEPLQGVDFYEVSLMDLQSGKILLRDSTITPRLVKGIGEINLEEGKRYFWIVQAHLRDGRVLSSAPTEFRLQVQ